MTIPDETREDPNRTDVIARSGPDEVEHDDAVEGGSDDRAAAANDRTEAPTAAADGGEEAEALLPTEDAQRFRERWESLQAGFVDRPRDTVAEADDLVRDLVQELTAGFVQRRETLEQHWNEGDEASTEDLRIALTHYRAFFNRLLST